MPFACARTDRVFPRRQERGHWRIAALLLLVIHGLAHGAYARAAGSPEPVAIPTSNLSTSPAPLKGFLFMPSGSGPHPAVVMLHGCGGAYASAGRLGSRHRMWGGFLAAHGYVALMLDSFSSRGIKQICTVKYADRKLRESDRAGDAYAALAYLRSRSDIDGRRVALLGWSHGAGVTLDAITRRPAEAPAFSAAVAFYPGCTARNAKAADFHPYAPLLVLIGEADDWTPAAACKELAAKVAAQGGTMSLVTYPDTYHDFDNPGLKARRVRADVPNGVHPGQGVTVAPNPQAREDAKTRVLAFLSAAAR